MSEQQRTKGSTLRTPKGRRDALKAILAGSGAVGRGEIRRALLESAWGGFDNRSGSCLSEQVYGHVLNNSGN